MSPYSGRPKSSNGGLPHPPGWNPHAALMNAGQSISTNQIGLSLVMTLRLTLQEWVHSIQLSSGLDNLAEVRNAAY